MNSKVIEFMKNIYMLFLPPPNRCAQTLAPKPTPVSWTTGLKWNILIQMCVKELPLKTKTTQSIWLITLDESHCILQWPLYVYDAMQCVWVSSLGKLFKTSSESLVTEGSSADVQVAIVLGLMGRALGCLPPEKWKNQSPLGPSVSCKVKVEQLLAFGWDQHVFKVLTL